MPSSMCCPWSDSRQRTSVSVSSANQSMRSPTFQMPALLIQPPRFVEEPTSGDTVTTRAATSGASCSRSTQKRPSACWVDSRPRCSRPSDGRDGRRLGRPNRLALAAARPSRRTARPPASRPRSPPTGRHGSVPSCRGQLGELLVGQQRRVVGGMALGRQPPALDRVGEDDARPVAHGVGRCGSRRAARRGRGRRGRGRRPAARRRRSATSTPTLEPPAGSARAAAVGAQQALVLLVGHRVDARARSPRLRRSQAPPVLDHLDVPAGRLEHGRPAARRRCRAPRGRATGG